MSLREYAARASEIDGDPWTCPRCGCRHWRVVNTYYAKTDGTKRRQVYCRHCKYSRTTYETPYKPQPPEETSG